MYPLEILDTLERRPQMLLEASYVSIQPHFEVLPQFALDTSISTNQLHSIDKETAVVVE